MLLYDIIISGFPIIVSMYDAGYHHFISPQQVSGYLESHAISTISDLQK